MASTILHKFVSSLTNKEKAELLKVIADTCYAEKGKVLDYLYDIAGYIAQEPDPRLAVKKDAPKENWKEAVRRVGNPIQQLNPNWMQDADAADRNRWDSGATGNDEPNGLNDAEIAMLPRNKIGAIKALRERLHIGLKEAKDMVDAYRSPPRSRPVVPFTDERYDPEPYPVFPNVPQLELNDEEKELMRAYGASNGTNRGRIQAIKLLRQRTDWNLRDCVELVHKWAIDNDIHVPGRGQRPQ